jgi:diguanylate cyclase (GGDEF)-like protein
MNWLVFCFFVFSQSVIADVFVEKLISSDQIKTSDFVSFQKQIKEIELHKKDLSEFELSYLQLLQAYQLAYTGQSPQSISLLSDLMAPTVDETISFRAKALLINSLLVSRRYLDAFNYVEQLIGQLPDIKQPIAREQGISVIAMMYMYVDLFDNVLQYTALLESEASRPTAICGAKYLKLNALLRVKKYDEFKAAYADALQACEYSNDKLWANFTRLYQAQLLLIENKAADALRLLNANYSEVTSTKYPGLIAEFDTALAQAYLALGNPMEAKKHAVSVASQADFSPSSTARLKALQLLSTLAKLEKNYQQALEYHEQYMAAFTAYMDDKSAQQMAYHTAHSEILAQNQKIALLDKDNQLLQLEQDKLKHQATSNQLLIVALVVMVLGLALMAYRSLVARQRFKALAEYDDLTAISNRYHFSVSAKDALNLCQKGQLPVALIVFDLDYFKQINDQYGHAAGDWALRQTVDTCRNFMRNNDVFGRIGGEEFAILLPGCQSDKAHLLADICRDAIKNIDTAASGYEFKLTASFGVTSAELSGYHLTKLIEDADTAMYQAKQQGRDKVQFFQG